MIDGDIEQLLRVGDFEALADRKGDNPPTLLLKMTVTHQETGHTWTQAVILDRDQWLNLIRLLNYAARNEGLLP